MALKLPKILQWQMLNLPPEMNPRFRKQADSHQMAHVVLQELLEVAVIGEALHEVRKHKGRVDRAYVRLLLHVQCVFNQKSLQRCGKSFAQKITQISLILPTNAK